MLSNTGYRRRTLEEIIQAKIEKAKELFGENINTEENTALGKYIRINAYDQYKVEEIAEQVYYSIFPQTATGVSLDRLGWSVGMSRNAAIPAQHKVSITGTAGETVPYGFLVGTELGLHFYNTADTVISADGNCEIIVECVDAGEIGNVASADINKEVNPVAYVDTVQGIAIERRGEEEESDYDFRQRFEVVREGKGGCTVASIVSALTNIDTVQGAYVVVNQDLIEMHLGNNFYVDPKSIACFVKGGAEKKQEIAEAIFEKKPIGVGTNGTEMVNVSYGGLKNYSVHFSYSEEVKIYVKIEPFITNTEYQASGNSDIKANIEKFIADLNIGVGIVTTALYSQIYSVAGVVSAIVTVSTDGTTYNSNNIEIDPYNHCVLARLTINGTVIE